MYRTLCSVLCTALQAPAHYCICTQYLYIVLYLLPTHPLTSGLLYIYTLTHTLELFTIRICTLSFSCISRQLGPHTPTSYCVTATLYLSFFFFDSNITFWRRVFVIRPSRSNAYIIDVRHRRSAAQAAVGPGLRAEISVYAGQPVHALGDMEPAVRLSSTRDWPRSCF